ncbi:MAG: hypothetical protein IT353_03515 [Gemmatimonadaceae bacterium]|nr:hypothetical protein [Gemmatimonadaceae bacterium]
MPDIFAMSDAEISHDGATEHEVDLHAHFAAERTRVEAESYDRGYRDAERALGNASSEQIATTLSALTEAITSVQLHAARWTANAEENITAIAVTVARHIVEREVTIDPTIVRDLVNRALAQFPIDQTITVRLHPDDAATCSSAAPSDISGRVQDVRWVADAHIVRGGCLVEGRERIIDGRVDTSLERAYRSVGQIQA